jgi:hypothetical protein
MLSRIQRRRPGRVHRPPRPGTRPPAAHPTRLLLHGQVSLGHNRTVDLLPLGEIRYAPDVKQAQVVAGKGGSKGKSKVIQRADDVAPTQLGADPARLLWGP